MIQVRPDPSSTGQRVSSTSINQATSGLAIVVAGTASQAIRVMGLMISSTGAQTWKLQSSATDLHPAMALAAGGSFTLPICGEPYFLTTAGADLSLTQSTSVQLSGKVWYTKGS